jgi:hypothetical protein
MFGELLVLSFQKILLMEIAKINNAFDNQIRSERKYSIDKELFNLTLDFTINDYRRFRTEKYWNTLDSLETVQDKKLYTLTCVRYYVKKMR